MIPTTSLWQIVDKIEDKLDAYIYELKGNPRREKTEEKSTPEAIPYCLFRKITVTRMELNYSWEKFSTPFNSIELIKRCIEHGVDDCQIQKLVLHFVEAERDYKFYFTTKEAKVSDEVGQYVKSLRDRFLQKSGKKTEELKELRQLELDNILLNDMPLPIEEQMNLGLLRWLQEKTYGLVLVKKQVPRAKTVLRDLEILNGFREVKRIE